MICKGCGCSDEQACYDDESGETCSWVAANVCSFCWAAEAMAPGSWLESLPATPPAPASPVLLYDAYGVPVR